MEQLVSALIGAVIGALVTGIISIGLQYLQNRASIKQQQMQSQAAVTLRMYEQYETPEMAKSRIRVLSLLKNYLE